MQQIREARNGAGQESPARRRGTNGVAQHRPRATVVHQMAGRTRLRIPDKRRDQPYFDQVADRLRELPGVTQVEANATTASVLIEHEQNLDDLAEAISGNSGLASLVGLVLETPPVAQRLRSEIMTSGRRSAAAFRRQIRPRDGGVIRSAWARSRSACNGTATRECCRTLLVRGRTGTAQQQR